MTEKNRASFMKYNMNSRTFYCKETAQNALCI